MDLDLDFNFDNILVGVNENCSNCEYNTRGYCLITLRVIIKKIRCEDWRDKNGY